MNVEAMQRFFLECKRDLSRIAYATRGELELGDIENTAYEIAVEIQEQRGKSFDFDSEMDRTQLLKYLHARLVKFADKSLRFAVSLDEDPDEERPTQATLVARSIKAHESSDPVVLLARAESEREAEEALLARYSELVAYLFLFRRYDTRKRLAQFLHIDKSTLYYRVCRAHSRAEHASLFDGVERIDPDFAPVISRGKSAPAAGASIGDQYAWAF